MSRKSVTAYLGRTREGDRVFAELSITREDKPVSTIEHGTANGTVRLSASGFTIPKGRRYADSAGQMLDVLDGGLVKDRSEWSASDVRSLLTLWRHWHLNDMRAGCAHMTLPEDESYDARKHVTCPVARVVKRDGKPVSPVLPDENAAFAWLLHHQGMSTDWALKHEGYSIERGYKYGQAWLYEEPPADVVAEWERLMGLPTGNVPTTY